MHPFVVFMIIWAVTVILTLWMMYYTASNLIKEFANNGWLLNYKKLESMPKTDLSGKIMKIAFIPVVNLILGFYIGMSYSKNLRSLAATSTMIADPMTEEQKTRWKDSPKVSTAIEMMTEKDKEEQNAEYKTNIEKKIKELKNNIEELKKEENNED